MRRKRLVNFVALLAVVALGLGSRSGRPWIPDFVARYAGDTLWALAVFLIVGILAPRLSTWKVALVALIVSVADEFSQLYRAPWIDAVRGTRIGALILGQGFLWSDLACYGVGVCLGAICEMGLRLIKTCRINRGSGYFKNRCP